MSSLSNFLLLIHAIAGNSDTAGAASTDTRADIDIRLIEGAGGRGRCEQSRNEACGRAPFAGEFPPVVEPAGVQEEGVLGLWCQRCMEGTADPECRLTGPGLARDADMADISEDWLPG